MPHFHQVMSYWPTAASDNWTMSTPAFEGSASLAVNHRKHSRLASTPKATPTDGTPTACQRALAIPELLEGILLQHPPRQVFVLQRVHTIFKNCVKECPKLREHLYLKTKNGSPQYHQDNRTLAPRLNDVLFHATIPKRDYRAFSPARVGLPGGELGLMTCQIYPKQDVTRLQAYDIQNRIFDLLKIGARSYNKMYLADSPTSCITIELWQLNVHRPGIRNSSWSRAYLRMKWVNFEMVVQVMQSLREAADKWGAPTNGERKRFDWRDHFCDPLRELVLRKPYIANAQGLYR